MTRAAQYQPNVATDLSASITSGQQNSAAIDLSGTVLGALHMPGAFTGTTVTILAAPTIDGTYNTVTDGAGNDYTLTVAANKVVPVTNFAIVASLRFIKIRSGSAEGADRTITLATRPV